MTPRLQLLRRAVALTTNQFSYQPLAPFLYPILNQQRSASILSSLSDNKGAYNKRIRRGRGPASGKGKTSGRGHKGQKQHGKVPFGFNGGQTPEVVVNGTRGWGNEDHFSVDMSPINLDRIQHWINQGRLDPAQPITLKELATSRCIHGVKDGGVKLLARGRGELTTPINLIVSRASAEAIKAIEKLGGSVTTRFYTKFAIKKILRGEMDSIHSLQSRIDVAHEVTEDVGVGTNVIPRERQRFQFRLPDPTSRKDFEYYRDTAHRGYLSHLVEAGQGPSLFFKAPGTAVRDAKKIKLAKEKSRQKSDNRLW